MDRSTTVIAGRIISAASCFLLLFCCRALAAPPQLYGKSVVVRWTENRLQRPAGETRWRPVSIQVSESVYISTLGRLFSRMTFASPRGSGAREFVGESGRSGAGGTRAAQFQGRSLVTVSVFNGGARHIQADFDPGFTSCSASVIIGKAAGATTFTLKSASTGVSIEVQSQSTSGATCSVRDGNVFAK